MQLHNYSEICCILQIGQGHEDVDMILPLFPVLRQINSVHKHTNTHTHTLFLYVQFNIILPSIPRSFEGHQGLLMFTIQIL